MLILKKAIPRRTFLRGAGATLALPFLDAMVPAMAAEMGKQPLRIGYIYLNTGRHMDSWIPRTTGRDYEMSPTLAPLAKHRDDFFSPQRTGRGCRQGITFGPLCFVYDRRDPDKK